MWGQHPRVPQRVGWQQPVCHHAQQHTWDALNDKQPLPADKQTIVLFGYG